jgi:hypothetical protein
MKEDSQNNKLQVIDNHSHLIYNNIFLINSKYFGYE